MVDSDRLRQLAPHYLLMFIVAMSVILTVRALYGDPGFIVEVVIIAAIVFAYRPLALHFGFAPEPWVEQSR